MDVVKRKHTFVEKTSQLWKISLTSLLDHLNGKFRS